MNIALAAVGFKNGDIKYNKEKISKIISECNDKADLIVFGETFLQGFDALSWNYEKDKSIAIELESPIIEDIRKMAKEKCTAICFGLVEKDKDSLYSSQLTIGANGDIVDVFRRVSDGWKESCADAHYKEGDSFHTFEYLNTKISIGLCGDLWDEEYASHMKALDADIVIWPVYTDFNFDEWNSAVKYEYAEQAAKCGNKVLYVNSVCLDRDEYEIARGGAAFFEEGKIIKETPSGKESVLYVSF